MAKAGITRGPRWADLRDSSAESLEDTLGELRNIKTDESLGFPSSKLPVANSFDSYVETPDWDLAENPRSSLNVQLGTVDLAPSPGAASSSQCAIVNTAQIPPGMAIQMVPVWVPAASGAGGSWQPNPGAPIFKPSMSEVSLPDVAMTSTNSGASAPTPSSSAATPAARRRINGKRSPSGLWFSRKRARKTGIDEEQTFPAAVSGEPRPLPEASEEDWQRRMDKRQAAVAAVKTSTEYGLFTADRTAGKLLLGLGPEGQPAPPTPDPLDRTISKRRWEEEVRQWRVALRQWAPSNGQDDTIE